MTVKPIECSLVVKVTDTCSPEPLNDQWMTKYSYNLFHQFHQDEILPVAVIEWPLKTEAGAATKPLGEAAFMALTAA